MNDPYVLQRGVCISLCLAQQRSLMREGSFTRVCVGVCATSNGCSRPARRWFSCAASPSTWVLVFAAEISEWPKRGCALRKPSLPCVEQETSEATARSPLSSPVSTPHGHLPMVALLCFQVPQSSCMGETLLTSPPGSPATANSLDLSCGWSGRGVETPQFSHRN